MLQCARDYKEIVDHVSFKCREIGKQGPCQDGEILVLNKESDCFAPFCLSNGGCSEDEIFYDGDCWGPEDVIEACEGHGFIEHILVSDSFGNSTCQIVSANLDIRGVFNLENDSKEQIPKNVTIGRRIEQEVRNGDLDTLQANLCKLHCSRNLPSFKFCDCEA